MRRQSNNTLGDHPATDMVLERGTQIAYVPTSAHGDLNHPDVEFGFVTIDLGANGAFCRYWRKDLPPTRQLYSENVEDYLRTKDNSELTPRACLVVLITSHLVPWQIVRAALEKFCGGAL
jgi:hypothetical protein